MVYSVLFILSLLFIAPPAPAQEALRLCSRGYVYFSDKQIPCLKAIHQDSLKGGPVRKRDLGTLWACYKQNIDADTSGCPSGSQQLPSPIIVENDQIYLENSDGDMDPLGGNPKHMLEGEYQCCYTLPPSPHDPITDISAQ